MTTQPGTIAPSRLARLGFRDVEAAGTHLAALTDPAAAVDALVEAAAGAADPDVALAGITELVGAASDAAELLRALAADRGLRSRLAAVCGASPALADHLRAHPEQWLELRSGAMLEPAAAELLDTSTVAG